MLGRFCLRSLLFVSLVVPFAGCGSSSDVDSITISPTDISLGTGATAQLTAIGTVGHGSHPSTSTNITTTAPWTDKNNPDPGKRGRPLTGVEVFAMAPDGPGKWSGSLYNADNGQTYPGHIVEVDPNTIRVEGCAGICGGQNMRRIQ